MIELEPIESILAGTISKGTLFEPSDISLSERFVPSRDESDEAENSVDERLRTEAVRRSLTPKYPKETQVVAIDSTSLILGQIPDGLVGALRVSVVVKPAGESRWKLTHYGPFLVAINEQGKDLFYQRLYRSVYGLEVSPQAPDLDRTLDQTRNLFERHIQQEFVKNCKDSLILLDGSLVAAAIVKPSSFARKILDQAAENGNSIVAVSKTTKLVLERSRRNILSLLDGVHGPCCVAGVKPYIKQNQDRYLGEIYVAKFTLLGEPFRVDLPSNDPTPHHETMNAVSGLAGDYGYPEELRLAHMTAIFSAIEILELQSAATVLHGLDMKEELRTRLFPL